MKQERTRDSTECYVRSEPSMGGRAVCGYGGAQRGAGLGKAHELELIYHIRGVSGQADGDGHLVAGRYGRHPHWPRAGGGSGKGPRGSADRM